jgi:centromere protein I
VLHPTVIAFLKGYMPVWNGRDNQEVLLDLLCLIPFGSFDDAYATYFSRVEQALASSEGSAAYVKVVDFYTSVLQQRMCRSIFEDTHRSEPAKSKPDRVIVTEAIKGLTAHVSTLSTSLLVSLSEGVGHSLVSSILAFYELLSASARLEMVLILLPSMHLVYLMSQHASSTTLSRICGIISSYKVAFDRHPRPIKDYYSTDVTDTFNCCLRDLYNLVWVHHAFQIKETKSAGLYCDEDLGTMLGEYLISIDRQYTFGSAFMLSNNAWLASLSATAWRAMEEREIEREAFDRDDIRYHQGPVSSDSLKVLKRNGGVSVDWDGSNGYKVFVLNWLAERGLEGVRTLMFAIVTDLRGNK